MSYKQIKITTGEEIVCKVIDFESDNTGETMVIMDAYILISEEDYKNGIRYYSFKPFMMWQEKDQPIILNAYNVISIIKPHDVIVNQYKEYMKKEEELRQENSGKKESDNVLQFNTKDKDKMH